VPSIQRRKVFALIKERAKVLKLNSQAAPSFCEIGEGLTGRGARERVASSLQRNEL